MRRHLASRRRILGDLTQPRAIGRVLVIGGLGRPADDLLAHGAHQLFLEVPAEILEVRHRIDEAVLRVITVVVDLHALRGGQHAVVDCRVGVVTRPVVAAGLVPHPGDVAERVVAVELLVVAHRRRVAGADVVQVAGIVPVVLRGKRQRRVVLASRCFGQPVDRVVAVGRGAADHLVVKELQRDRAVFDMAHIAYGIECETQILQ